MSKNARRPSPFDLAAPRVFSIDAGRPFLDDLADGLIDALGEDLPRAEIFLPTRRAVRAAADAILAGAMRRGVRAALLPRFRAIGDVDDEELIAFAGETADEIDVPPAINATERLALLARFAAAKDRALAGRENWPAAIAAARELAALLDAFHTEEIVPAKLKSLDVEDAAGHWAEALRFLEIVTDAWPTYLETIDRADPAARRARLIDATARRYANTPPAHPVVIAGTTASAPAVARLVKAIAAAPRGAAVLPGLDRAIDRRAWEEIEDAHPQSGLKALLAAMAREPADVAAWPGSGTGSGPENARQRLLALALRPAEATDDWLTLVSEMEKGDATLANATRGLALVEADNEEAEATAIAALFRETIAEADATAMLVTPDRTLARRVALKMRRWGVEIDDSAGVPFANTRCGVFLRLVALYLDDPGDPVAILALVGHPLSRLGDVDAHRRAAAALDRALRGARPARGLATIEERLAAANALTPEIMAAIATLQAAADDFPRAGAPPFEALLVGHIAAAERLAGAERLWSGDDGEKGAEILADLRASAPFFDALGRQTYADLFEALIAGAAVRRGRDAHPRLSILGPLEARLQSADHIVLGGLNEGTWPSGAASDPFLSRSMREALKLPSPERRIGLSAHDFAGLAAQPRVTLTRARRAGGQPASPSRWIVRFRNILKRGDALARVDQSARWRGIVARLDDAGVPKPVERPRPKAGPGRRPTRLSVTRIETWLRDPYAIYAEALLSLRKLDPPGAAFGAREMGSLLHRVFEQATRRPSAPTPGFLRTLYDAAAPDFGLGDDDRVFWSADVADAFDWFAAFDAERRAWGVPAVVEGNGVWRAVGGAHPFALSATADRIDLLKDGRAALVDYKTGKLKTEKQDSSFSPQLALTGAMVAAGAFDAIGARAVARYEYCKALGRSGDPSEDGWELSEEEAAAAIAEAKARLIALIEAFDRPDTVYHSQPRPEFTNDYGDYDQLARRKEWAAAEDGDGGGE